jgi:hypothetical protein
MLNERAALGVAGLLTAGVMVVAPPTAANADSYAPGPENQAFAAGPGGWTHQESTAGVCVALVLCPAVTDDWVTMGGAGGEGYLRTQFTSLLTTLAGSSTGTWQSPTFTYHGDAGQQPTAVTFDLDVRPQVADLLGASQINQARFRVDLFDLGTDQTISVVPPTALTADTGWTTIPTATINPALLHIGSSYAVRIATTYQSLAALAVTGEVGYDNIRLTATRNTGTSDGTGGDTGGGPGAANGGSGITTVQQLRRLVLQHGLKGAATLARTGKYLTIHLKSPAAAAPLRTTYRVRGVVKTHQPKKYKPTTSGKAVTIRAGAVKTIHLKIRPRYLATYQHANRILVRVHVRVGNLKVTLVKRVELIHRRTR